MQTRVPTKMWIHAMAWIAGVGVFTGASAWLPHAESAKTYYTSVRQVPAQPSDFHDTIPLDKSTIQRKVCPPADHHVCGYGWIPAHVQLNDQHLPLTIAINPLTVAPYLPDIIWMHAD